MLETSKYGRIINTNPFKIPKRKIGFITNKTDINYYKATPNCLYFVSFLQLTLLAWSLVDSCRLCLIGCLYFVSFLQLTLLARSLVDSCRLCLVGCISNFINKQYIYSSLYRSRHTYKIHVFLILYLFKSQRVAIEKIIKKGDPTTSNSTILLFMCSCTFAFYVLIFDLSVLACFNKFYVCLYISYSLL